MHRKQLLSNYATNQKTIDKQEAPKTICKYIAAQGLSVNLNFSKLSQNQNATEVTLLHDPIDHSSTYM